MTVRVPSPAVAAVVAAALVTPLIPAIAPAAQASPYAPAATATVDQGDLIYNETTGQECAVGWLKDGYAFTAGQCGTDGDLFRDIDDNYLGAFETRYDPATRRNDFGWIKLDMEVGEGANRFNDVREPLWNAVYFQTEEGRVDFEDYHGFDGATGVAGPKLGQLGVTLGQPVFGYGLTLVGLYSGELDGYSLITRPDQIADSPNLVDAAYIADPYRHGDAQHARVWEFNPHYGYGSRVSLPEPARIDQGAKIVNVTGQGRCTVGFINDGVVYTAGHCGKEGDEFWLSTEGEYDPHLERIGTFHTKYAENESEPVETRSKLRNDHGFITIESPWVQLGSNGWSGDKVVPYEEIRPGLEVCAYGQTTREKGPRCGRVEGVDGAEIVMSSGVDGEKGDSGGPVWAKDGSGFVGIYSGGPADGSAASASYPYVETDNKNEIRVNFAGILRSFALGVPYYSVLPLYSTYLGVRGEQLPIPPQTINQGDLLYNWRGEAVCRVGYVQGQRLYFASDCGQSRLFTAGGREVTALQNSTYYNYLAETSVLSDGWWGEGRNLPEASRVVPWNELQAGDQICTTGKNADTTSCTTFIGLDGPRLILEEPFEGDFALPGGPLWVPGKGFAGVYTESPDKWGHGMRIDMVYAPGHEFTFPKFAVRAWELGETYYQHTPAMFADETLNPIAPVPFPERTFKAGEKLYDDNGEAVCEIARVEDNQLLISSECPHSLYTRLGENVGSTTTDHGYIDQVATVDITGHRISAGQNTATPQVDWQDLKPGERICAGSSCTEFAGYDGSKIVLAQALTGVLPGAALNVKGKGFAGIYHGDGIGSRPDMIEAGYFPSNAAEIRAAHRKGEQFYAHNDANFWSVRSGVGGPVPFPSRVLNEGMLLFDDNGNPTCQTGRVDKQKLYVSSNCDGAVYTAAGEYVGEVASAPNTGDRAVVATIDVTGRRMQPGTNTHAGFAAWDAIVPGDKLCSDEGCGEFLGLDGANIVHTAPVPAQPGAALWNPKLGFVGVSGGPGKTGSRIDMVTEADTPEFTGRVLRARELGTTYYQRATARFWDGNSLGSAVPFERHPAMNQGDALHDVSGNPACTIGYIDGNTLFTSSECGGAGETLYSAFGEELGTLEVPAADTSVRNRFGYVRLDSPFVSAGVNGVTGNRIAEWNAAQRGDEVCTVSASGAKRCGTYLGQDGSAVVVSKEVAGERADLGGPIWIPGKGFLAVNAGLIGGSQTGARIDMITHDSSPAHFAEVAAAFERNETFYQKAHAHYFSLNRPYGERVPFPKKPVPAKPVPSTPTSAAPSPSRVTEPTKQVSSTSTDRTVNNGPAGFTNPSTTTEPSAPSGPTSAAPQADGGSTNGSSTAGIIAAIVVPLVLIGLGFLATQFIDTTQFGLPPVPKVLPF